MHIGISRPPTPPDDVPDVDAAFIAQTAEKLGFESVFYGEHPITPVDQPGSSVHSAGIPFFQDTLVALARASAVTTKIKIGSGVFLIPLHQPVQLAKQLASLDFYSGGRLIIGAGVGWSQLQCEAMGGKFDRRWARTREAIQVMRMLWTQEITEFHGEFYDIPPVKLFPKPASKPWPPVLLPGPPFNAEGPFDSPQWLPYFKRIAAYADGWIPPRIGIEQMRTGPERLVEGRTLLKRLCKDIGRDPAELQITAIMRADLHDADLRWPDLPTKDILRRYEDVGVERCVVSVPTVLNIDHAREVLTRMAEDVLK